MENWRGSDVATGLSKSQSSSVTDHCGYRDLHDGLVRDNDLVTQPRLEKGNLG